MTAPVAVLGVPYDARSSFLRGAAEGPRAVRQVLHGGMANWSTELGTELEEGVHFEDLGDLDLPDDPAVAFPTIRDAVAAARGAGRRIVSVGGDHSITFPIVEGLGEPDLTILHFDAHPDLYDELDGDRLSHACPFARIMEADLATRLIQVGIRTATAHQREQAARFGVETFTADEWDGTLPQLGGPVYVTIDLDAIDPSEAPGISHHEPAGLRVRQILRAVHELGRRGVDAVGADIVELNPSRDLHGMTAAVTAKLLREVLGVLAAR
jgi:agmatinase